MKYWLDRKIAPDAAATHALIVGVSTYSDLDKLPEKLKGKLRQLNSAATAAWKVACWLRDRYNSNSPLGTIQLLASPSSAEKAATPELGALPPARREDVRKALFEWKRLCQLNTNGVGILYVAGHGIACSDEQSYVLLEDFGSDPVLLEHAVDVSIVRSGMLEEDIAQNQLYFVDACRIPMAAFKEFRNLGQGILLPGSTTTEDRRCSPVYFSAAPGTESYGEAKVGTVFSQALIQCLDQCAAREPQAEGEPWHVTTSSLEEALESRVQALAKERRIKQTVVAGGQRRTETIHTYKTPPEVPVSIRLRPDEAQEFALADLSDSNGVYLEKKRSFDPNPLPWSAPAGIYQVEVSISPEGARVYGKFKKKLFAAKPPASETEVSVG